MLIRPPRYEDIEQLLDMGERMHHEGAYAFLPFDREKVRRMIVSYIHQPETQCGLVAEENGVVFGMFAGYLTDYFFCDEKVACDLILFVDQERRGSSAAVRLVNAFRDWAAERGAMEICLGVSTNVNRETTGRFYEKLGLLQIGGLYKQRLEHERGDLA
jgi:GNAT superfamily N-acetyltransferase